MARARRDSCPRSGDYFFLLAFAEVFFGAGLACAFAGFAGAGFFGAADLWAGLACALTCADLAGFGAGL